MTAVTALPTDTLGTTCTMCESFLHCTSTGTVPYFTALDLDFAAAGYHTVTVLYTFFLSFIL